jgi:protein SCO1/2
MRLSYAGRMIGMDFPKFRTNPAATAWRRMLVLLAFVALLAGCTTADKPQWRLTDVSGHLPDLKFQLTDDNGHAVDGKDYRGKVAILYFGYTHCPDVCPLTLTRLHVAMQRLGTLADDVRILFVSVDPARDTPQVMHAYVNAFDPRAVGLTGSDKQIEGMAKRYRSAYSRGAAKDDGGYDMNHSSAIYIFDADGRARLIATPSTSNDDLVHDLHLLLATEAKS